MTRDERRGAIAGPVGVGHGRISPVLLTRLVNDVGDNPDQLSILQHALNRTWAHWQNADAMDALLSLPHYEAIGTMAHALDRHAEKAYGELTTDRQRKICETVFKAITDKGTDARGIRRPTRLATLCELADATEAEVIAVLDVFRKPSRSFLMPPIPEKLDADSVIDISHESLMRVWERLRTWTREEAQSAQLYRRLAETAALHEAGLASLWRERELQLAESWYEEEKPTAVWAERYQPGFEAAIAFLKASKERRNKEIAEKEENRRQQVEHEKTLALAKEQQLRLAVERQSAQRMKWFASVSTGLLVLSLVAGIAAFRQRSIAQKQETIAKQQETLVTERTKQIQEVALPTRDAAETILKIQTELGGYNDTLKRLDSETTDPNVKSVIRKLSTGVQNWQKSAGTADQSIRETLLKQQQIVAQTAPAAVQDVGWIFLGKVNEGKNDWVDNSPETIAPTSTKKLTRGSLLTIIDDVYLRGDVQPGSPHNAGRILSVVKAPADVEVLQADYTHAAAGGFFVWAKVQRR
jgi:hypothetical protein